MSAEDMLIQADTLSDEAVVLYCTPSYFIIQWRHIRKLFSLHTGIQHEDRHDGRRRL